MARTQNIPWLGSEVGQGAAGVTITQDRGGDLCQLTGGLGQMETAMVVGGPALAAETSLKAGPFSLWNNPVDGVCSTLELQTPASPRLAPRSTQSAFQPP